MIIHGTFSHWQIHVFFCPFKSWWIFSHHGPPRFAGDRHIKAGVGIPQVRRQKQGRQPVGAAQGSAGGGGKSRKPGWEDLRAKHRKKKILVQPRIASRMASWIEELKITNKTTPRMERFRCAIRWQASEKGLKTEPEHDRFLAKKNTGVEQCELFLASGTTNWIKWIKWFLVSMWKV